MKEYLKFKAGPGIFDLVKQEGIKRERIRVFAGPAGGPKWFVSVGLDKAFIRSGFLLRADGEKTLLSGSSAGAWRCLAMACKNPLEAYEKLRLAYSRNVFTAADTPGDISGKIRGNVESFISDEDVRHITENPVFDVAVHVVRSKGPAASSNRRIEGVGLIGAGLLNVFSSSMLNLFYERVVFYSGKPRRCFRSGLFEGESHPLEPSNLKSVALATGSLPYIIAGVTNIPGLGAGVYRDGGLTDYQLNQDYDPGPDGFTLFFHYQERITPGWFDKKLSWRKPLNNITSRVLQLYPGEDFIDLLPDKRIPDRSDFTAFVDNPSERIRRWDEVSKVSDLLADYFFEVVESGKIRDLIRPL